MPLRDHFRPPLSLRRQWQSVHSAWANAIAGHLNEELLPERYVALPNVVLGGTFEVDVAAWETSQTTGERGLAVATSVWAPSRPTLSVPMTFATPDLFEVQIVDEEQGRAVAAIELVSPANKDREAHREAFAIKCAANLQAGLSVLVLDAVTTRRSSPHGDLMKLLEVTGESAPLFPELCAAAYRLVPRDDATELEAWVESLDVGRDLPSLPLWLAPELAVPLDLELTYEAACRALRIE